MVRGSRTLVGMVRGSRTQVATALVSRTWASTAWGSQIRISMVQDGPALANTAPVTLGRGSPRPASTTLVSPVQISLSPASRTRGRSGQNDLD